VGYLFILGGIFMIITPYWINGLWLAFIGWILANAAAGSYRQVALKDMLQGHTVSEVLTRDCPVIPPKLTVEQLVNDYILGSGRHCFPVVEDGLALGLVTMHNVKAVPREIWPTKTVRETMTPLGKLKWVRPNEDLSNVMQLLTEEDVNQVPVMENNTIVGLVTRDNLLSFIRTRGELGI
jgi:predicted transcriptional regulator